MWTRLVFTLLLVAVVLASHKKKKTEDSSDSGESNEDYSDEDSGEVFPQTSFTCKDKIDGFYADIETGCRIFHYCQTWSFPDETEETKDWLFQCPPTTIFRQQYLTCSAPHPSFRCEDSENFYDVNEDLQGPVTPPPGSVPMPTRPPTTNRPPVKPKPTTTTRKPTTSESEESDEDTNSPTLPNYPEEVEPTTRPPTSGSKPSIPSPPLTHANPTVPSFLLPPLNYRLSSLVLPQFLPPSYIPILPPPIETPIVAHDFPTYIVHKPEAGKKVKPEKVANGIVEDRSQVMAKKAKDKKAEETTPWLFWPGLVNTYQSPSFGLFPYASNFFGSLFHLDDSAFFKKKKK